MPSLSATRFPISVSRTASESAPAVAFTYVASEQVGLDPFIKHLRTYRPLFACLSHFQFVYISTASQEQEEAAKLFALLIQGKGLADLLRYFSLNTKWDNKQYGELATEDLIFLSQSRKRCTGESFATLYYLWKRKQLPEDLKAEGSGNQNSIFKAMTVFGHDAVFGTEMKRWGDGWKVRGTSRATSPRGSPGLERQVLPREANA